MHGSIERFTAEGVVHLPGAFPRSLADAGRALLWRRAGLDPDDPTTWTQPVVRLGGYDDEPFRAAANTPVLHAAFDALVGPGRWVPPTGLGTWPIRFPPRGGPVDPGDGGWHIEASIPVGGGWGANVRSDGRALLMLFLFSDVGPHDAPTRVRAGSHRDVPALLAPHGDRGADVLAVAGEIERATRHRPVLDATGAAGDVYLCHPFLVHAAQPHRGTRPRFLAQPPLLPIGRFDPDRPVSPVERTIADGLAASSGPLRAGGASSG